MKVYSPNLCDTAPEIGEAVLRVALAIERFQSTEGASEMFDTPADRATPSQLAFAKAHAERLARFRRAALKKVPPEKPVPQPPVAPNPATAPPLASHLKDAPLAVLTPTASALLAGAQSMRQIAVAVSAAFGLTYPDLVGPKRSRRFSAPRQLAMFLCRERLKASWPAIGRQFGSRDHTTVIHAFRRTQRLIQTQRLWAEIYAQVTRALEVEVRNGSAVST